MKIINLDLTLNTKPKSLIDITFDVSQHVQNSKILNGRSFKFGSVSS